MKNAVFISRHAPSEEQIEMMAHLGYTLNHVGDVNVFDAPDLEEICREASVTHGRIDVLVGVHPMVTMHATESNMDSAVFHNGMRPVEGAPPTFFLEGVAFLKGQLIGGNGEVSWGTHYHTYNPAAWVK